GSCGSSIRALRVSTPVSEKMAVAFVSCSVTVERIRSSSARAADWRSTIEQERTAMITEATMSREIFQRSDMRSACEAVAESANGFDHARPDLLPQTLDVDVDDTRVAGPFVAPDGEGDLLPGVHMLGLLGQQQEDPQLGGGEVDLLTVDLHRQTPRVEDERAEAGAEGPQPAVAGSRLRRRGTVGARRDPGAADGILVVGILGAGGEPPARAEVGVIGFELGPQSILGVHSGAGAEHLGDAVAGDHAAGTDHGLVLVVGVGGGRIAELVGAGGDEPADDGADPSVEDLHVEGFGQVVVGS